MRSFVIVVLWLLSLYHIGVVIALFFCKFHFIMLKICCIDEGLRGFYEVFWGKLNEQSIDSGEAYRIMQDGKPVGGVIISVNGERGDLEILFVSPKIHSKGIGYAAWCEVEKLHPEVKVWETVTPYFEKRNIHFYVKRCGFHIVEFYNSHHPDPNDPDISEQLDEQFSRRYV